MNQLKIPMKQQMFDDASRIKIAVGLRQPIPNVSDKLKEYFSLMIQMIIG